MKLTHWTLSSLGLVAALLIFFLWGPQGEAPATIHPIAIIDLLLDAGADPRLENEHGEAPWKVARLHSIVQSRHLWLHEKIAQETEARGLSAEAYLASQPHLQEWADGLLEGYLVEAKIQRVLLTAAVNATPKMPIQ